MDVMLPTLGPERRATYSPFMPLSPKTGQVMQNGIIAHDVSKGTVTYREEDGEVHRRDPFRRRREVSKSKPS